MVNSTRTLNEDKEQISTRQEKQAGQEFKTGKRKLKVAVLGASGLVGQYFVRLLAGHPYFELSFLTSSEINAGKKFKELAWPELFSPASYCPLASPWPENISSLTMQPLGTDLARRLKDEDIRVVFSALPASVSMEIEPPLRNQGLAVFTNSSACRLLDDVPVAIPEVNQEHLALVNFQKKKYGGFIAAGSNCCVAGLALSLKPLLNWEVKKVRLTTFQSISGAGFSGLRTLDIYNNVIPFIKNEEQKIAIETVKILGSYNSYKIINNSIPVLATCARVPVRFGHLIDVEVEFQNPPDLDEIKHRMVSFPGLAKPSLPSAPEQPILMLDEENRPQPAYDLWAGTPKTARGMAVCLGRLRYQNYSLRYLILVNNLIRGAAGNCLLTAELAFTLGYLD